MKENPEFLRFFATYVAGRPIGVAEASAGDPCYTDGRIIFVSAQAALEQQRSEVLLQSALLAAGSLDSKWVKSLRGRPSLARRFLSLEGDRVLYQLRDHIPLATKLAPSSEPVSSSTSMSLSFAKKRGSIAAVPEWYGVIRPSRLLAPDASQGAQVNNKDLRLDFDLIDIEEADNEGDEEQAEQSRILKLFENPLFNSQGLSDYFRKLFGVSRIAGEGKAGAEMQTRTLRKVQKAGQNARPLPTRIRFADSEKPSAAFSVSGSLHPEWDVHKQCYRSDWCRVINFPLATAVDINAASVQSDKVLHGRLARLGLKAKVLRRRPDGEDVDVETLTDFMVDVNAGHSPPENIFLERRKLERDLGVLILVDASGSVTDSDAEGLSVHEHQRRTAATLAMTLEGLGDRVAVYGFRSQGRAHVHLLALKPFAERFGVGGRARLNQLEPSGYTRLGAGIRGAGEILKKESGTSNRLLLVLSDGFPYDDGYEHHYAEADAHKALGELRSDGIGCLCLSIGTSTSDKVMQRVFGSASHATALNLSQLSPRMDELFLSALKDLAAPTLHFNKG